MLAMHWAKQSITCVNKHAPPNRTKVTYLHLLQCAHTLPEALSSFHIVWLDSHWEKNQHNAPSITIVLLTRQNVDNSSKHMLAHVLIYMRWHCHHDPLTPR